MSLKVFRVAEMVAVEKAAHASGVSYSQMMETAGWRVAEAIMSRYPVVGLNVLILVGPGNNGGDGLVAGRYLAEAGAHVAFYLYQPRSADSDENYAKVQQMGLFVIDASFDQRYRVLRTRLKVTDLLIDALLGTGVSRPISGGMATLLKQVQTGLQERKDFLAAAQAQTGLISVAQIQPTPAAAVSPSGRAVRFPVIVAVDCPSGLNCDTGALDALAVVADLTVTFAGPKRGHFCFPGAAACGELVVADIGIPPYLPGAPDVTVSLMTAAAAQRLLPPRPLHGHKSTFGWVGIAAGAADYWGAPVLAARGAYRVGAGLVALAVPARLRPAIAAQMPEATYLPTQEQDTLGAESALLLRQHMGRYKALLIGPGLGSATTFMERLFTADGPVPDLPPLVIDADGLNLLARQPDWPQRLPAHTILTPHPGEMARLMGADMQTADRVELAQTQARAWGHVVVLKGAYTVVAAPDGRAHIIPFANPILGTAGSGDVLAGAIAGLLAQGMSPIDAAALGAYLHGAAGQLASATLGDAGLLAGELADWLPQVRHALRA